MRVQQGSGIVGGAVVYDDGMHLRIVRSKNRRDRLHDDAFFVVRRNQHCDLRRRIGRHGTVRAKFFDQRENADDDGAPTDQNNANDKNRGDTQPEPVIHAKDEAVGASLEPLRSG